MSTIKKQHHTVPVMHLKHFTCDQSDGKVWIYDKQGESPSATAPDNAGCQKYFYAVRKPDNSLDNRLEDYLSQIEAKADPIYQRMLNGIIPSDAQERHDFATFLSLMYFRTPTMRRISAEVHAATLEMTSYAYAQNDFEGTIRGMEEHTGRVLTEEQKASLKEDMLNPGKFEIHVPAEQTLRIMEAADGVTPLLEEMHWSLITPKHGFFITSDNPLYKAVDPKTLHPIIGGNHGFTNKTVEVTFPLSPKKALYISWRIPRQTETTIERFNVDMFNAARAFTAERFVYGHINHKKITMLVQEHRTAKVEFQMQGGGPKRYSKVKVKKPARSVS